MSRPRRRRDKESQEFVDNMMYLLTAPRIVAPGNTYTYQVNDNIGESLIHRLAEHKEIFENEECTEFEAMIYLSTINRNPPDIPNIMVKPETRAKRCGANQRPAKVRAPTNPKAAPPPIIRRPR